MTFNDAIITVNISNASQNGRLRIVTSMNLSV